MNRIQLTDSNKLMVVCGHALEQMKVGFPVHTLQGSSTAPNDGGKVVLCEFCFEMSKKNEWDKIPAGTICEHCFIEESTKMKMQRKVN